MKGHNQIWLQVVEQGCEIVLLMFLFFQLLSAMWTSKYNTVIEVKYIGD